MMDTPTASVYDHRQDFTMKVMNYVALAFGITAVGAYSAPLILPANFPYMLIFIAELILVFTARKWAQMARPTNVLLFSLFAFLSGITLYPLLVYALAVGGLDLVIMALGSTVCLALAAGVYANTTQRNLSGIGGFLMMTLLGLIVVGILQFFFFNETVELISAGIGVILFSAFIAYDIQMLRHYQENQAIEAAIGLYLSLLNLFTSILRLMIALNRD